MRTTPSKQKSPFQFLSRSVFLLGKYKGRVDFFEDTDKKGKVTDTSYTYSVYRLKKIRGTGGSIEEQMVAWKTGFPTWDEAMAACQEMALRFKEHKPSWASL